MMRWPGFKRQNTPQCDSSVRPYAVFDKACLNLGGKQVLTDLTISLSEKRVGVIGLNGSGKSSFARLFNGLRFPDQGEVTIFGARTQDAASELPGHVGFVFQNPDHQAIFPTVEEEVAFGLIQLGQDKHTARANSNVFLEQHDCAHLAERPFLELSGGQKQLVCLLSVLVMQPGLLILDEPMTSLDALSTGRIRKMLTSLPQSIVMVSHDLDAFAGFDRVIWLEDGRVRMDGPPDEVCAAYREDVDARLERDPRAGL